MFIGITSKLISNTRKILPNLWGWGLGSSGQLGQGDFSSPTSPRKTGSNSNWKSISCALHQAMGIKTDGTLWGWGVNTAGQLGLNDADSRSSPVQVGTDTNWSIISLGGGSTGLALAHGMAIKTDGTLWGWGKNNNNTNNVQSAAAGAGRLGNGSENTSLSPIQVGTGTTWSKVSAGTIFTLATKTDGTLWAWGSSSTTTPIAVHGCLGLGDGVNYSSPVQVGTGTDWYNVIAGASSSFGIKTDGTLWAWGTNVGGQLGLGDVVHRSSPVQVGTGTTWSFITTSRTYASALTSFTGSTFGIKTDGTLWGWGLGSSGQLGLGDTLSRSSPVQVGTGTTWSSVTVRSVTTLATKTDGTLWAWGSNTSGQFGGGANLTSISTPALLGTNTWTFISCNVRFNNIRAIASNGTLWVWGTQPSGELFLGDIIVRSSAVQVGSDTNWTYAAVGDSHSMAIKGGALWTCGDNTRGQLGHGNTTIRSSPVQVGTDTTWSIATGGTLHTHAIKTNGTLWGWGYNFFGTIGDGTAGSPATRSSPVQIGTSTNWTSITNNIYHALGISGGALYGWGINDNGQLGLGNATNRSSPVQVGTDTDWSKVVSATSHSVALKSTGTLWAWGNNSSGQLGLGNTTIRSSPVQVGTDTNWSKISTANAHTLAIKTDGTLWAWGSGSSGQLGLGDAVGRSSPVQVGTDTTWSTISAGATYSFAIKTDGSLWSWGNRQSGISGDGVTPGNLPLTICSSPVQIGVLNNWKIVELFTPGTGTMALKNRERILGS